MIRATCLAAVAALLALAAPAAAQTALFTEDAEGDPAARWSVGQAPDGSEPWQPSDSDASKYRGNMAHGGAKSFWSGVQPQNWPVVPTTAGPGTVIEGESTLTLKTPILVPADGTTTLSYWSLFQNEGDDQGIAQVALADPGSQGTFKNVKSEAAVATGAGDSDPRACDPTRPDHTLSVPFEEQKVSLAAYAGHLILLRFVLKYGAENRPVSHPCGWYLDDIAVTTTGTPGNAGGPPAGGPATPPAARAAVKFGATKLKGRRATLSLTVSGSELRDVTVTLLKGKRRVATAKAASLAPGRAKVAFKLKRKLKRGAYSVKLAGTDSGGAAYASGGRTKAR